MAPVRAFLIAAAAASFVAPARAAVLHEASGLVQVRAAGTGAWRPAGPVPRPLAAGDAIRTGYNAAARVASSDGSVLEMSGNAHLFLEDEHAEGFGASLLFGSARLTAAPRARAGQFVRAPAGVVKARAGGAVVRVVVAGGGAATVIAERGAAGVEDARGRSVLLREGERVELDAAGLHEPAAAPPPPEARRLDVRASARRELALDLARDADLAAVTREVRRQERELGRALADADGRRVRVEEFVVRPAADRVVLVTLNERGGGLSYWSWDGTFDRALPRDLAPVMESLDGGSAAAAWTLTTAVETHASGADSLVARAEGGHQVDLNANADPGDDVPGAASAFATLFDRYGLYANGVLKRGWTGAALTSYADRTPAVANDPITGAALAAPLPAVAINEAFPDAGASRRERLESYGDGAELLVVDLALRGPQGGAAPRGEALGAGMERRLRATEFGSRSVGVVFGMLGRRANGGLP